MNWFQRTFHSKKQEVRGKKKEAPAFSSYFLLLTSYFKFLLTSHSKFRLVTPVLLAVRRGSPLALSVVVRQAHHTSGTTLSGSLFEGGSRSVEGLVDSAETFSSVDKLAYQKTEVLPSDDLMTVKLRYKDPDGETSKLIQQTVKAEDVSAEPAGDFQFASVVAEFGLILRDSKFKGNASYEHVLKGAGVSKGKDSYGYREEFIELVGKAQALDTRTGSGTDGINFKGE